MGDEAAAAVAPLEVSYARRALLSLAQDEIEIAQIDEHAERPGPAMNTGSRR